MREGHVDVLNTFDCVCGSGREGREATIGQSFGVGGAKLSAL